MIVHKIENAAHQRELELIRNFSSLTLEQKEDLMHYFDFADDIDWTKEEIKEYQSYLDDYYANKFKIKPKFSFTCSKCKNAITKKEDFYFTKKGKILCSNCIPKGGNKK